MTTDSITADSLPTVCKDCGAEEFTDASTAFGLRVNRYCNNDPTHSMGHYYRAASPTEFDVSAEPASAALVPVDTATAPINAADIVAEIKAEHEACVTAHAACLTACADYLDHAMKCGELLIQAKSTIPHGEWEKWIGCNLTFAARTARKYMQLFANRDELLAKRPREAVLSLSEALRLLTRIDDSETVEADASDSAAIGLLPEPVAPVETHADPADDDEPALGKLDGETTESKPAQSHNLKPKAKTEPKDKLVKSGTEVGVPIPLIKDAFTAIGHAWAKIAKVLEHPDCKSDEKSLLFTDDFYEATQEWILSANGPVQIVDGGWMLMDADESGLAATTVWRVDHVKAVRADQLGDAEPE